MQKISFIISISLCCFLQLPTWDFANAHERAIDLGHILTPTTRTLAGGDSTAGSFALAYGISDTLFIATSPWGWINYNSSNIHLRWVPVSFEKTKIGFFASYFESFPKPILGDDPFHWKSASLSLLYSYAWTSDVETFLSARTSYYWNDDRPYSIRMDSGDNSIRGQFDATSLTRVRIKDSNFRIGFEFGSVGLNYLYPYLHFGSSVVYIENNWQLQFGFTYTAQWRKLSEASTWRPGRIDSRIRQSPSDGRSYYYPYETALHPEIQVQYYF